MCVCRQNSDGQSLERFTGMCVCACTIWPQLGDDQSCLQVTRLRICGILFSIHPAWGEFSRYVCHSLTCEHACTHTHTQTYVHLRCSIINISSTMKSNKIRMEEMDNITEQLWTVKDYHFTWRLKFIILFCQQIHSKISMTLLLLLLLLLLLFSYIKVHNLMY